MKRSIARVFANPVNLLFAISISIIARPALLSAQQPQRGIVGREAPSWGVEQWLNLPAQATTLDISDLHGKVVYLYCFQSWCPGCHSHGFPTLQAMIKRFQNEPDVAFVAVQTVFEGFHANTVDHAKQVAKKFDLSIPIGQSGSPKRRSVLMRNYRTGGTPWTVIIDKQGVVRFNDFQISESDAFKMVQQLLQKDKHPADSAVGRALIGETLDPNRLTWLTAENVEPPTFKGKVTVMRWWTDTCRHCAKSVPALSRLSAEFGDQVELIGVFHAKARKKYTPVEIKSAAKRMQFEGRLCWDKKWSLLRSAYLNDHPSMPTSITLVLDRTGTIQYVDPGPGVYPAALSKDTVANQSYQKLRRVVARLAGASKGTD